MVVITGVDVDWVVLVVVVGLMVVVTVFVVVGAVVLLPAQPKKIWP